MNEQEKRYYGTSSAERTENEIEREHAHGQPAVPKREWEGWMVLTVAKEPRSFHPSQAGATHACCVRGDHIIRVVIVEV